jgi:hypothetical protein
MKNKGFNFEIFREEFMQNMQKCEEFNHEVRCGEYPMLLNSNS